MLDGIACIPTFWLCVIGGFICFLCTTLGAGFVFIFKNFSQKYLTIILAFSGGVMIASSFFSLIIPAIQTCEQQSLPAFLFITLGFFVGGTFIIISSKILDRFFTQTNYINRSGFKRSIMLTASITLHNIPEGMAVGVAFGSLLNPTPSGIISAFMLAIGIGIQNIPEGASVALPLKREGVSTKKAFSMGILSGIVEPIFAPIAFCLCFFISGILPFLLSFAAGTMIAVAVCELLPEAVAISKNRSIFFLTIGFVLMALLDLVFG